MATVNVSCEKIRGIKKVHDGSRQVVEKGNFPILVFSLMDGGGLQKSGEKNACSMIDAETESKINLILLRAKMQKNGSMKYYNSAQKSMEESNVNTHLPKLPNEVGSKFWNQKYKKRVFTQVMKAEGIGKHLKYKQGSGPEWWENENNLIKWEDFTGPSQSPSDFKGNFSEFLFGRILECFKYHNVDVNKHIHNPPLGKYTALAEQLDTKEDELSSATDKEAIDEDYDCNPVGESVEENEIDVTEDSANEDDRISKTSLINNNAKKSQNKSKKINEEKNKKKKVSVHKNVSEDLTEKELDDGSVRRKKKSSSVQRSLTKNKRNNETISLNTDMFANFSENNLDLSIVNEDESEADLNDSVEDLDLRLSESELETTIEDSELETSIDEDLPINLSNGALRKIHKGEKEPNAILQIGEFNYMPNNECYQLLISDGKESSHKVCLDRKYTDQMTNDINSKKGMIIQVNGFTRTKNKTTVIITDFTILKKTSNLIGQPRFLKETFFQEIARHFFETEISSQPELTINKSKTKVASTLSQPSTNKNIKRKRLAASSEPGKTPISKKTRSRVVLN